MKPAFKGNHMKPYWISRIVLLALAITSCGLNENQLPIQSENPSPSSSTKATDIPPLTTPEVVPTTQGDTTPMPELSNPTVQYLITTATDDLANRISISKDQIQIKEATEVVWPNSSLGCPQPGMVYAEVLTPGYLILLNANNQDYEYHAGKNSEAFYCENPTPPVPGMSGDT